MTVVERNKEIMKIIEKCSKGHSVISPWPTPAYPLVIQLKRVLEKMLGHLLEYSELYKVTATQQQLPLWTIFTRQQDAPMIPHFDDESNPLHGVAKEMLGYLTPLDWQFLSLEKTHQVEVLTDVSAGTLKLIKYSPGCFPNVNF